MILFLIQTHKDPEHLQRLINLLLVGCTNAHVLVSHDKNAPPLPHDFFEDDTRVNIISGSGGRGDFLILDGYLSALRFLRENPIEYEWLINLSGSDFPVTSLKKMEEELTASDHDGFLHHFDALDDIVSAESPMFWSASEGYDRYYYSYKKLKTQLSPFTRKILAFPRIWVRKFTRQYRINTAYGLMIGRSSEQANPFNENFKCFSGSYWHVLRRKSAEHILNYSEENAEVLEYFRRVLVPDESFIQTVLVNNTSLKFSNDCRRFFDMKQSRRGHPLVLNASNLAAITSGAFFFARKIEPHSGEELLQKLEALALS